MAEATTNQLMRLIKSLVMVVLQQKSQFATSYDCDFRALTRNASNSIGKQKME